MAAQSYGSAPPRIGSVAPGTKTGTTSKPTTGIVGKAMGNAPIRQDANRVSVKTHTRSKPSKGR